MRGVSRCVTITSRLGVCTLFCQFFLAYVVQNPSLPRE
jgi:hypothetical protein